MTVRSQVLELFFFFNDTATTEIYTLSLHDALPIYFEGTLENDPVKFWRNRGKKLYDQAEGFVGRRKAMEQAVSEIDRKSTRLNSSHSQISYAVFCLKKKTTTTGTVA